MALEIITLGPGQWTGTEHAETRRRWRDYTHRQGAFWSDPRWLTSLCQGLHHQPYGLIAQRGDEIVGVLPLSFVKSMLFGRFLVSLPYVNTAGLVADDETAANALIDRAVELADELDVRYLELRHETERIHPALTQKLTSKIHMRLALPETAEELWKQFKPKVRNQIRKGEKQEFTVRWGGLDRLDDFYTIFSHNMRDLGTPVFSRGLFTSMLEEFPDDIEFCTVHNDAQPIAASMLIHSGTSTQVPSASSLRAFSPSNVNMLMYWNLLSRAIERGQAVFDFGRSSEESNTFRFKKQWGAVGEPAVWQYYVRKGGISDVRPESAKYRYFIKTWQRMPLWLSRTIGPPIVRGIP